MKTLTLTPDRKGVWLTQRNWRPKIEQVARAADRKHIPETIAGMIAVYGIVFGALLVTADHRYASPMYDSARDWAPVGTWGVGLVSLGALTIGALTLHRATQIPLGLTAITWTAWAGCLLVSIGHDRSIPTQWWAAMLPAALSALVALTFARDRKVTS